jgi:DNA-binding MarR family transcriptional regulator/GNAT superfamily N-acetyltransferase
MATTVDAVRSFNRFHTRFSGALDAHILSGDLTLTEARLLYELATASAPVALSLQQKLGLDAGYVSRMLKAFERRGWIARSPGAADRRTRPITLTAAGRAQFAKIDREAAEEVEHKIAHLDGHGRGLLEEALSRVETLLSEPAAQPSIRPFRAGDMGYVTARQAIVYREQFGWDSEYEALVGEITAKFLREFNPEREQCWIAERHGEMVGSIFLVDAGEGIAQLRLLYVEPSARGFGIGNELTALCVSFARERGYERMRLWTNDVLVSARRIYEAYGFALVEEEPHHNFGKDLIGQTWELPLHS